MIDLTIHADALARNIEVARKNHIILPTYELSLIHISEPTRP